MRVVLVLAAALLFSCSGGEPVNCTPQCFRNVRCVTACGATPVSDGCCSCAAGTFDDLQCPRDGG